jgi:peptidyl-dipeptidase Dcp
MNQNQPDRRSVPTPPNRRNVARRLVHGLGAISVASTLAATDPAGVNPLLPEWAGPFGGLPPFDRVQVAQFKPAFAEAIQAYRTDLRAIAESADAATFANTIEAFERSGRAFGRVQAVYRVWGSTLSTPDYQAVERDLEPQLAALRDEIHQNEKLFRRIEAVYLSPDKARLTPEQQRLVWLHYTNFVRAGAKLSADGKARVAAINQRLASLYTSFSQNLLADEENDATILDRADDLNGLPDSVRAAAAAQAQARGLTNRWAIANTRSSVEPFLTYSTRRELRERVWRAFVSRGDHPGPHDNKPAMTEILQLRAERAGLLGYASHAHWRLENSMARTPDRALDLMTALWAPAVARVREEVADMQKIADAEGAGVRIQPWDYRYYAEKVRKDRYDLDDNEVKPYLQLDKLRDGMFWAAGQIYGLAFAPISGVPVYHPDVQVFEVKGANGQSAGVFYFDPFARRGKRSGAWASAYRPQEKFERPVLPMISNNSNFLPAPAGQPVLVSWGDAETLFHEFGHALHGLSSDVQYPALAGSSVARDYVELPSQLNERWLATPELLSRFARHHRSGEPMPSALVVRIAKAAKFNRGFATVEFLASALLDMRLHLATNSAIDPAAFERDQLAQLGMPAEVVMRHRLPQFAHIFANEGYSAGYYSYLWADTLTADAAEAFIEAGGFYDKRTAERYHRYVLSAGNTVDPAEAYRQFRGRDAGTAALLRDRGFPVPPNAQ